MNKTVCAVIVTYNRQPLLKRCIEAVCSQSYKVDCVIIVNNASTDNTKQFLENSGFERTVESNLTKIKNQFIYIDLKQNTGGSGGFYSGLKFAHENGNFDYFWLMDDDGYPSKNCLEQLMTENSDYDYIMPVSIDVENHDKLSWATRKKDGKKTEFYEELKTSWGKIMNYVTPFNGVLLSEYCVSKVGYINKDFFIWGDDYEHYYRCKKNGINPVTFMEAKFFHPAMKLPLEKICFGFFRVPYVSSSIRMICLVRNYTYIYMKYNQKYKIPVKWLMYTWLFLITRHGDFSGWILYNKSMWDGIKGNFTRHIKYLKYRDSYCFCFYYYPLL